MMIGGSDGDGDGDGEGDGDGDGAMIYSDMNWDNRMWILSL